MPYPSPLTRNQIKQITLQVVKFNLNTALSLREMTSIHAISPEILIDEMVQRLVVNLKIFLVQGHREEYGSVKRIEYHADWRQSFKARWFNNRLLRWLIRRYPIRMTTVEVQQHVTVTRVCPHLPVTQEAVRDGRTHISFLTDERGW